MMATRQTPVEFFYSHAGSSYDPTTETEDEGRRRGAGHLAAAERWASEAGYSFQWQHDPFGDSSDFSDSGEPWKVWACACHAPSGEVVASLGGIDFGPDGGPWGDPYRRVIEAELATEAMGD